MSWNVRAFHQTLMTFEITRFQWHILSACHYGPKPSRMLIGDALSEAVGSEIGPMSGEEAAEALDECFSQEWLRVIDARDLREISALVQEMGLVGPIRSLPGIGDVDFAIEGAHKYRELYKAAFDTYPGESDAIQVEEGHTLHVYCPTLELALKVASDYLSLPNDPQLYPEIVRISDPAVLKPWCGHWWEPFPTGYRLDIQYREPLTDGLDGVS